MTCIDPITSRSWPSAVLVSLWRRRQGRQRRLPLKTPERPLVALDYHRTIEFNQTVNEVTIRHLQDIQRWGYYLTTCSFSSNTTTLENTLRACREIEKKLLRPFVGIHITRTKLLSDQEQGPSITGDTGAKAIVLKKTGACVFCDDQPGDIRRVSVPAIWSGPWQPC